MSLSNGGVQIAVKRGESVLSRQDVLGEKSLPPILHKLASDHPNKTASYFVSYPTAQKLKNMLSREVSETFQLDSEALDDLQVVTCPSEFRLRWRFDAVAQALVRSMNGADMDLGGGWFYKTDQVWHLDTPLSTEMASWVSKSQIHSRELLAFVTRGIEQHRSAHLLCDLSVTNAFQAKLTIVNTLKHSLDIQVTSSMPELQKQLVPLRDDEQTLLSGYTLIPHWGRVLKGSLLEAAKTTEPLRIEAKVLPAFIQDELLPNASALGCDIDQVRQAYPIEDAIHYSLSCKLERQTVEGIGRYFAVLGLSLHSDFLPIQKIFQLIKDGARFYRTDSGWLEFTPAFKARCAEWEQKNPAPIQLALAEALGTAPERLNRLKLQPPVINIPRDSDERQHAIALIETMRQHGLPAGLYGLQQQMNGILADVCVRLIQENKRAKILWLLPSRKKDAVRDTLKQHRISYDETLQKISSGVSLATPESGGLFTGTDWTLIIFSDLDLLASGDNHSKFYASIRRLWSIGVFSREDWYQDERRAQRALRVLGLNSSDLKAFLKTCMGMYTKESETFLSRITSPFKKIILGDETSTSSISGLPIPQRPPLSPSMSPPKTDLKDVFRPSFAVPESVSSGRGSFVEQAKRYVNTTYPESEPVPFMRYFPTYDDMTPQQRQWYFYWRSQVRQSNYIAADLSYLFVHIYEILHCVGFADAQSAFNYLVAFWQQYRSFYNRLDGYLIDWIADFVVVYKLPQTPLSWYAQAVEQGGRLTNEDLAIEAWLLNQSTYREIPEMLLELVSEYKLTKSKFYQQHNQDGSVSRDLRQGIQLVSDYLQQQTGKSLFEYYRPSQTSTIHRVPFASAVYDGLRQEIVVANVASWSTTAFDLQTAVTSILKYSENLLRRQRNFRGTLRGISITPEWAAVLDAAFPDPNAVEHKPAKRGRKPAQDKIDVVETPPPAVATSFSIDYSKVAALADESADLTKRLTVDDEIDSDFVELPEQSIPAVSTVHQNAFPTQLNLDRPQDTPAHLLTDLREVGEVISQDQTAVMLLHYFVKNGWEIARDVIEGLLAGEFLSVVLDQINERALELLGDNLFLIEDGQVVVAEDYRDEAEHLFKPLTSAVLLPPASVKPAHDDLTLEWSTFADFMQVQHWESLNALLSGNEVKIKLDGIARSVYTTADLLVDEINEFALMSIGDIVIETGDPPTIEDEDLESLRLLMAWALENHLQEH